VFPCVLRGYAFACRVTFLAKVENTFSVTGRGLVLVPAECAEDFRIRVGTPIQLRTPEGHTRDTHITGVEFLCGLKEDGTKFSRIAILITRDITKQDAPSGTEIWYLREDSPENHPSTTPTPAS
jgi:translation elongation factor EF-Tu-like GTPase